MGQIIKFPIVILTDKADETKPGISPQLQSTIRQTPYALTTTIGSDKAVRDAINEIDITLSGSNLTTGFNIFDSTSYISGYLKTGSYNTLSGQGVISVYQTSNNIILDTTQSGDPGSVTGTIINTRSINGGIWQEASKLNYSNFSSLSTMECFHNITSGDAIGKVMIKCSEPFNSSVTQYSIGVDNNKEGIVRKFSAPLISGNLVNINYGDMLLDKIEIVEKNKSYIIPKLKANSPIKVYRYGTANTAGEMNCVIFYDKNLKSTSVSNSIGAIIAGGVDGGGTTYNSLQYFSYSSYSTSTLGATMATARWGHGVFKSSTYIWYAGGVQGSSSNTPFDTIERINAATSTSNGVNVSTIPYNIFLFGYDTDNTYGWLFGGMNYAPSYSMTSNISRMSKATEVCSMTGTYMIRAMESVAAGSTYNYTYAYIFGGYRNGPPGAGSYNEIQKYNYAVTTDAATVAYLSSSMASMSNPCLGNSLGYIYIMGGVTNPSTFYNNIQKYNTSTDTSSPTTAAYLTETKSDFSSSSDYRRQKIYSFAGQVGGVTYSSTIESFNMSTDTVNGVAIGSLSTGVRGAGGYSIE